MEVGDAGHGLGDRYTPVQGAGGDAPVHPEHYVGVHGSAPCVGGALHVKRSLCHTCHCTQREVTITRLSSSCSALPLLLPHAAATCQRVGPLTSPAAPATR